MQYSDAGLALTRRFEAVRLSGYKDGAGQGVSAVEADALLRGEMANAIACVNELVRVPVTQGQFDGLADFAFDLGNGTFRRSTLLAMVNRRDFTGATRQFGLWVHARGRVEPELVARRNAEAAIFNS